MGKLLRDEPLSKYTTWRVGGPAKQLHKPANLQDLSHFLASLPEDEPLLWLGLGSNTLIRDGGFNGTVILTQGTLRDISLLEDNKVRAESGVSCALMARFCARNNLVGGEFWAGIPGTMGGALRMNAGCFNGETWDKVCEVELMDRKGSILHKKPRDFKVGYRSVEGVGNNWFIGATFQLEPGDKASSLASIKQLLDRRAETQPTGEFNCGSVFRNPPDDFAARLIESCGLKGFQYGKAKVSEKHANFIINDKGLATAAQIEHLIGFVHETVLDKTGIDLHREVHILGEKNGQ